MNTTKTWGELRCSGRVSSSCSTSDTRSLLNDINIIWYGNRIGHQYRWINTNSINKTRTPYIRNGSIDETNFVLTSKYQQTSQHGTKKVKTCNWQHAQHEPTEKRIIARFIERICESSLHLNKRYRVNAS